MDWPDSASWIDGLPTTGRHQSCAFCGTDHVAWMHPLAEDRVAYRVYGKGHTLPSFWVLCDRCEGIYASGDSDAAVEVMRSSDGWSTIPAADIDECIRQPLEVFRRSDLGAKRLSN